VEVGIHGERNEEAKQGRLEREEFSDAAREVLARADASLGAQRADAGGVLSRGVAGAVRLPLVARGVEATGGKACGRAVFSGERERILQKETERLRSRGSDRGDCGRDTGRRVGSRPARESADCRGGAV